MGIVGDLAQRARQFNSRGSSAHDDEVQPRAALLGVLLALRAFESQQQAAADLRGVFDGLQPRRHRLPLVIAEIVVGRSGGDNQLVIRNLAIAQDHAAVGHVQVDGFAQQHFRIAIVLEHDTQGRRNFAGREGARGNLVEQRLEQVKVPAIHQSDRYGRASQRLGNIQPAKSAADDDHPMRSPRVRRH